MRNSKDCDAHNCRNRMKEQIDSIEAQCRCVDRRATSPRWWLRVTLLMVVVGSFALLVVVSTADAEGKSNDIRGGTSTTRKLTKIQTAAPSYAPNEPIAIAGDAKSFFPTIQRERREADASSRPPPTSAPTPTQARSMTPTGGDLERFRAMLKGFSKNPTALETRGSAEWAAMQWLFDTTNARGSVVSSSSLIGDRNRMRQRYAVTVLVTALQGSNFVAPNTIAQASLKECSWTGVKCTNGTVTRIDWADIGLKGSLSEEVGLLTKLNHLDLGDNAIRGTLPNGLYDLANLKNLFLHGNRFSGILSTSISKLSKLSKLYLGDNLLGGTFPKGLGSNRQLRLLSLYNNQLSGPLPKDLNLRKMYYLDLGRNQFSGTLPVDWASGTTSLRHLYLDHNKFVGTIPDSYVHLGGGRVKILHVNNNKFTGTFPGGFTPGFLESLELQHNNFDAFGKGLCLLSVFERGELTLLRSDCRICSCRSVFCKTKFCSF
jgi:hypothetical protein